MVKRLWPLAFLLLVHCDFLTAQRTVVSVGDVKYSEKYFSARLLEKLKSFDGLHVKDQALIKELRESLVQELVSEGMLILWARESKVRVGQEEIKNLLANLMQNPHGAEEDLLSESKVNKALLEDSLGIQVLKRKLMKELEKKIEISEEEIQSYYKDNTKDFRKGEIHVKQIFLEKEAEADSVLKFLRSGKFSFENLAQKYSKGPEAAKGGDMGWIESSQSPEIDALFQQGTGVQNKVVKSPQGYHLFKVVEIKKPALQPLSAVKEQILRAIKEMKLEGAYMIWMQDQIKKYPVKTNESVIRSLVPYYQETP